MIKKYTRLLRNNFTLNPKSILFLVRHALTVWLLNIETKEQFKSHYGEFNRGRDLRDYLLYNPGSEGGAIIGDVVYFVQSVRLGDRPLLLAGDRNEVKDIWARYFPKAQMVTCGIHEMDHYWNFEEPAPEALSARRFGLIISQATIEHLIDPYRHVTELAMLLDDDGVLVLHSVLPGFFYHRVPIDCFRFYPDWFEAIADRLGLIVLEKQISVFNITYKYQKMPAFCHSKSP